MTTSNTDNQVTIGIDTGGSYTDGVLFSPSLRRVLFRDKVPTSHADLRVCIATILEKLIRKAQGEGWDISMISLSTTLATNAIAEGKHRPAALFLIGYDQELIRKFGLGKELGTDVVIHLRGGSTLSGEIVQELDRAELARQVQELEEKVEAMAVSVYGGPVNSSQEVEAAEEIGKLTGLPVVQGHHLTSRMGSVQRAATAALNASLLSHATEFVSAVEQVMGEHQVSCPLILVRGDGSVAEASYGMQRPVEIIHSGPATSTIGGGYLAGVADALVIDVGGTTTDLGFLQAGKPPLNPDGALVGGIPTWVRTIRSRSFGLGGDSLIQFTSKGEISIGPGRVLPLCQLAAQYPQAGTDLRRLLESGMELTRSSQIEYWLLAREPRRAPSDERVRGILQRLREGPQRMRDLLKQAKVVSPALLDIQSLFHAGVLERSCLTPTDLMHATGEFTAWDSDTAQLTVRAIERTLEDDLVGLCRRWILRKLTEEILTFLSGKPVPGSGKDRFGNWVVDELLEGSGNALLPQFALAMPLVGIGAPARFFLRGLDELFHTPIIFPPDFEVANAVGTVTAQVCVRYEGEVIPVLNGPVVTGYCGIALGRREVFDAKNDARKYVREQLCSAARKAARQAGAQELDEDWDVEELGGDMERILLQVSGPPLTASVD